ncbi:hypothetical protein [uncultured Ruminococcus sp.]|uniref:hypothetical protein n=1 Tax=uncultured Ruminococcus sp. TaxID=165186 RepID=UPI00260F5832|nr:hypothetical protein [uncultured Ruminococcus sp.]
MKRTIIILSIIFAIIAAFIYYRINSENDSEVVIVNTEAGDSFKLSYDTYKNKSLIEDCNSRFNLVIHNKIDSNEIKLLFVNEDIKIYNADYFVFFDSGTGFKLFNGDLNYDLKLTQIVKNNLLSNYRFFMHNITYYVNSNQYHEEMNTLIEYICSEGFDPVLKYGLSDSVINDAEEFKAIKQEALKIKSRYQYSVID